jgi:hypothetical protein
MATPLQDIKIWDIQARTKRANASRPWVLRWKVDGAERSRAFRTKSEADHVRARLVVAARGGEPFDRASGLPLSWQPAPEQRRLYEWVREWLAEQWPEWQPRTRISAVEALSRFVPAVRAPSAPPAPKNLRRYLIGALRPGSTIDEHDPCERWLRRWSPPLGDLSREAMAIAERQLTMGPAGAAAQRVRRRPIPKGRSRVHRARCRSRDHRERPVAATSARSPNPQEPPAVARH